MYLALTIIYDIDYVRHFNPERNIQEQIEEQEVVEGENIVAVMENVE